ncbi:DUF885 domain-containing protein [Occallatibacter savannae]|uniref:DUF885 domain-containing protein n=1 Tax=Occallatibacter savannae TaxID=1002691 RepID=UPI000D689941|nr:DUF885 domain-containing protein [Occallatibacter savannae]
MSKSTIALLLVCSSFAAAQNAAPSPAAANAKFAQMSEQFIHETLAQSPSSASQAGYHHYRDPKTGKDFALDSLLDDVSAAGVAAQRNLYARWRDRFHRETPVSSLTPEDAADWHLIDDQIALNLLEFDRIQNYRHNPTMYVELLGAALFQPLTDDYASEQTRVSDVLARIAALPHFLDQARSVLSDADPIFIKVAVEENEGNINLIQTTIASAAAKTPALKSRFDSVAPPAIAALKSFNEWLSSDLAKRKTDRTWRLGKQFYDAKFHLVMETDITPEQLLSEAQSEFSKTRAEMLQLALPLHKQYYPDHDDHASLAQQDRENKIISEVLQKIADDHPNRNALIETAREDLVGIRQFIIDKKIVTLKSRDNLKVIPTPEFERGIYSVGGFHSAPPLDPNAEAQYWVTPISPSTPEASAESRLREYNNWVLKWLCIHEALPGHYVQAEHANDVQPLSRRLVRALYGNGAYVEGWAEYVAQNMLQQGFADNDPRYRISYLKVWLRAIGNSILDIRMQTMNMTDDQAMHFLMDDAFQTRAEAEGKLQRAKLSSTQLPTYFVGTEEWWRLRRAYEAVTGKSFTLAAFHDRALDEGALPVPWLKDLLLPRQ